jgi:hypothetical protein
VNPLAESTTPCAGEPLALLLVHRARFAAEASARPRRGAGAVSGRGAGGSDVVDDRGDDGYLPKEDSGVYVDGKVSTQAHGYWALRPPE